MRKKFLLSMTFANIYTYRRCQCQPNIGRYDWYVRNVTGFRTRHQLNRSVVIASTENERSENTASDSVVNVTVTRTYNVPSESVAPVSLPISLATGTNVTQSRTTPTMLISERSGPLPCEREDIDEPLNLSISQNIQPNVQSQLENENQRRMNGISEIESVNRESSREHPNSTGEMNVRIENACVDFEGENVVELSDFRTNSLGFSSTQMNRLSSDVMQLINQLQISNRNVSRASPSIEPQMGNSIENLQRRLQPNGCGQTVPVHQREPNPARQSNNRVSMERVPSFLPIPHQRVEFNPSPHDYYSQVNENVLNRRKPTNFSETFTVHRSNSVPNLSAPTRQRYENPIYESNDVDFPSIGNRISEQLVKDYGEPISNNSKSMQELSDNLFQEPMARQSGYPYRNRPTFVPINKWGVKFSGNPNENAGNLTIFLREIELGQRMYRISDAELHANFIVLLDGAAKMWYLSYCNGFGTWSELRRAIQDKYIGKREHTFYMSIMNRKQGYKESIGEYFADMMLKMSAITDLTSQRQISILINGLKPNFRQRVTGFTWNSVNQLEEFLCNIEADLMVHQSEENRRFIRYDRRENKVSAISEERESGSEPNSPIEDVSACCEMQLRKNFPPRNKSMAKSSANTAEISAFSGQKDAHERNDNTSMPAAQSMRGRCYKCGQEGHLFRQCTKQRVRVFCFDCGEDNDGEKLTNLEQSKN